MSRIAVVGAGLSGLVLARELGNAHDVLLFDKSRGVGGRMATRYAGQFEFDHGAQFFTARSRRFRRFLDPFVSQGTVLPWRARFVELTGGVVSAARDWDDGHPHYVGVPRMNALARALADELRVELESRVAALRRDRGRWTLLDDAGGETPDFDWVVLTAPAPQTAELLPADSPLHETVSGADMRACYALMLGLEEAPDLGWQAARVLEADLSWISVNSSKPGREGPGTLVVHSTNAWADAHVEHDQAAVQRHLLTELGRVTGSNMGRAAHRALHRWRYANLPKRGDDVQQVDAASRLAVCGDWCLRGRVEAAYLSATRLADELGKHLE